MGTARSPIAEPASGAKRRLLILTGPTAAGKTKLSLRLARDLSGEVISADSMQVYRGMDIGTDKLRPEEMEGVRHHLIDVLEPTENFSVYRFRELAGSALEDIYSRGRLPIVVGGTGFYIQALLYDIDFTETDDGGALRRELETRAKEPGGAHELWLELNEADPVYAAAVHENNVKRVIRALEYNRLTGNRFSEQNERQRAYVSPYDFLYFVLTDSRDRLYARIDSRVDEMMGRGLLEETRGLMEHCASDATSMQALGYRQMAGYLKGEYDLERAIYLIKRETRHFAKRQLTWFKRERDVRWLDRSLYEETAAEELIYEELMRQLNEAWGNGSSSEGFVR